MNLKLEEARFSETCLSACELKRFQSSEGYYQNIYPTINLPKFKKFVIFVVILSRISILLCIVITLHDLIRFSSLKMMESPLSISTIIYLKLDAVKNTFFVIGGMRHIC